MRSLFLSGSILSLILLVGCVSTHDGMINTAFEDNDVKLNPDLMTSFQQQDPKAQPPAGEPQVVTERGASVAAESNGRPAVDSKGTVRNELPPEAAPGQLAAAPAPRMEVHKDLEMRDARVIIDEVDPFGEVEYREYHLGRNPNDQQQLLIARPGNEAWRKK